MDSTPACKSSMITCFIHISERAFFTSRCVPQFNDLFSHNEVHTVDARWLHSRTSNKGPGTEKGIVCQF